MEARENKMGTMPIGKLLASMSGPAILSMLINSLYNIVDSFYSISNTGIACGDGCRYRCRT